ncbi:MAG TPA: VanZ family protein [Methylomirabilota bacterium]|jgi:VanZ family protein|nr:VanZ family protein [Methylomirabilota bacterium]
MPGRALTLSLLCLAAVLFLGSAPFGSDHIDAAMFSALRMTPLSAVDIETTVALIRKLGHIVEYAVLALAWFAALSNDRLRTPRRAAWLTLAICLTCAFLDEAHQAMIVTRTASTRDLWFDAIGAVLALTVARLVREAAASVGQGAPHYAPPYPRR